MMYTYTKTEVLSKKNKKSKTKSTKTKKTVTVNTSNVKRMLRKKKIVSSTSAAASSTTNSSSGSLSMITRKSKTSISFAQMSKNKSISQLNNSPLRKPSKLLGISKRKSFSKLTSNASQITSTSNEMTKTDENDVSTVVKRKSLTSLNKSASLIENELLKFNKENKTIDSYCKKEDTVVGGGGETVVATTAEGKSKVRRVGSGRKRKTLSPNSTVPSTTKSKSSTLNSSSDTILAIKPNNNISHLLKLQKINPSNSNTASEISNDNDLELDKNNAINYLNNEILKVTNYSKFSSSPSSESSSNANTKNSNSLRLFNNTLNPDDDSSNTPKNINTTSLFSDKTQSQSPVKKQESPSISNATTSSGSKKIRKLIDIGFVSDKTPSDVTSNTPKVPGKRGRKPKLSPSSQPIKLIGVNPLSENASMLGPPINGSENNNSLLAKLNDQIKTISMSNFQAESSSSISSSPRSVSTLPIVVSNHSNMTNVVRPGNQPIIYNPITISNSIRPSTPIHSLQISSSSSSSPTLINTLNAANTQGKPPPMLSFLQRPTIINSNKPSILITKRLNVSNSQINVSTSPKSLTTIIRPPLSSTAPTTNINLLNSTKTTQNTLWVVSQPNMTKGNSSSNVMNSNTAASVAASVAAQVAKETSQTIISSFLKQQQQQQQQQNQQSMPKITTIVNNNTFNANTNNFILNNTNNYTIISSTNNMNTNTNTNNNNNNKQSNINLNTSPIKTQIILNKTINLDFNNKTESPFNKQN